MDLSVGYHEFGLDGATRTGPVRSFELIEGVLQVTYDYVIDGVSYVGSFTATEEPDGSFLGTWKDQSNKPVRGVSTWDGSAHLVLAETDDRRTFKGSWKMGSVSERWFIETAK